MKVHLIKAKTVRGYAKKHSGSVASFENWINKVKKADWEIPQDMMQTFATTTIDILGKGSSRVMFDVGGNNYRILCKYQFGKKMVHLFVLWIGTHAEYDKLCANGKQYTIEKY